VRKLSLIAFTLLVQSAVGAFWALLAVRFWAAGEVGWPRAEAWAFPGLLGILISVLLGLAFSLFQLGRSKDSWRALLKLPASWPKREIILAVLFLVCACATAPIKFFPIGIPFLVGAADGIAALAGLLLLWTTARAYRITTDRWTAPAAFYVGSPLLGALGAGVGLAFGPGPPDLRGEALGYLAFAALGFLLAETLIAFMWTKGLTDGPPEARTAADYILDGRRGLLIARLLLAGAATLSCAAAVFSEWAAAAALTTAFLCAIASQVLGRVLFYEARVHAGV
jgi:DMSO reductase anchor subunit